MPMHTLFAEHESYDVMEFRELVPGIDFNLFRGPLEPETCDERAARWDAAGDILADLRAEADAGDEIAGWDALYADALIRTMPFLRATRALKAETGEAA